MQALKARRSVPRWIALSVLLLDIGALLRAIRKDDDGALGALTLVMVSISDITASVSAMAALDLRMQLAISRQGI